ncbi:MAG: ISAs1 family transposase, partial [Rhodospirillales bacterium]|nr:ISAs1 family transposase [Rhodospirillales bacterium]
ALFRRLGGVDHWHSRRRECDRWQDRASVRQPERRQGADPHGLGLRRPPTPRARPGQGGEKFNEIIAIPRLLTMLAVEGAIVTIDAMGCQREVARAILDKKADYVLALKGNQGSLREDVEVFAAEQQAKGFADTEVSQETTIDGDHGRIETRTTTVIHDVAWLQQRHDWPGLQAVVVIDSRRESNGKTERETRFYLTSLVMTAALLGPVVRSHWAIENSLHWVMDMMFRDDECRVRTDHAPANFTTIKHMAHNLLRTAPSRDSLRLRRKVAAWDDEFLARLVTR